MSETNSEPVSGAVSGATTTRRTVLRSAGLMALAGGTAADRLAGLVASLGVMAPVCDPLAERLGHFVRGRPRGLGAQIAARGFGEAWDGSMGSASPAFWMIDALQGQ